MKQLWGPLLQHSPHEGTSSQHSVLCNVLVLGVMTPIWSGTTILEEHTVYLTVKMKEFDWEFGWLCRNWIRKWPICVMSGKREQQRPFSWPWTVENHWKLFLIVSSCI